MPRERTEVAMNLKVGDVIEAAADWDYDGIAIRKGELSTVVDPCGPLGLVYIRMHEHHCGLHKENNEIGIHVDDAASFLMRLVEATQEIAAV